MAIGKVCAVSGNTFSARLRRTPQNYLTLPAQPWLDGINAGDGFVRQFVAVPLGLGATVEGQVTGAETVGGVQLQTFTLTDAARAAWEVEQKRRSHFCADDMIVGCPDAGMGLGAGGRMRQEVYRDDRPLGDYRPSPAGRVFVHLCSAAQWRRITGEVPPPTPIDAHAYTAAGLPWFDYYDADAADLPSPEELAGVKPVGGWLGPDETPWIPPMPKQTIGLGDAAPGDIVKDGAW